MTLEEEIARGQRAERLLNDELVSEAFAKIEGAIVEQWKSSPVRDTEGQQQLRIMLGLLDRLRGHFTEVVTTGRMASIQLETKRKTLKERISEWV